MHPWYTSWWLWLVIAVLAGLLVAVLVILLWLRLTAERRNLHAVLRNIADRLVRNVVLPDGVGGHIGVDALLLRDGKLYLLLLRHADGAVFAGSKMDQWSAVGRRRFMFRNPLHALQDRAIAVRALAPELNVVPRVLFTGRCHFPKGCPPEVERFEDFARPLRRKQRPLAALDGRLAAAWTRLCATAGIVADEARPAVKSQSSGAAAA